MQDIIDNTLHPKNEIKLTAFINRLLINLQLELPHWIIKNYPLIVYSDTVSSDSMHVLYTHTVVYSSIYRVVYSDTVSSDSIMYYTLRLLFWTHNGAATRGVSLMRLNGVGGRIACVTDNTQSIHYHAITMDTENRRIFWIKEMEGKFQIGVAEYGDGYCGNPFNKMITSELRVEG